jgi:hypothetical protein
MSIIPPKRLLQLRNHQATRLSAAVLDRSVTRSSWVVVAAIVLVFGLAFYAIDANWNGQKTANHSAVMAVPAPAAGVAPPAPQTTTGQAAPPAAPETTGRGEVPSQPPR